MNPDTLRDSLPKIVRWLAIAAVVLVVGSLVLSFVTTGTVAVQAGSSSANITISSLPVQAGADKGKVVTTQKGTGQLGARLKAGTYIISVQQGSSQANQIINVGWLSNQNVNLSPSSPTAVEPVLYESVIGLAADSSRLIYIDNDENNLEYIDNHNQYVRIPGGQYYTSAAWANPTYGVAQDRSGQLYVIDGSTSRALKTPVTGSGLTYDVAPNKTIYLALGSGVYSGTEASGFKQISNNFPAHGQLLAANDKVMIVNSGNDTTGGTATIVDAGGKTTTKKFAYQITGFSPWSPGGQSIEISIGSQPTVFDSSLQQVGIIPQPAAISGGSWLDDNTYFYGSTGQLWSHNLSEKTSNLVAALPDNRQIQSIAVSGDHSYVYFTFSDTSQNNPNPAHPEAVFRVGLHGQTVSSTLSNLRDVLPINASTYSIGLRNFAPPLTMHVIAYPGVDPNEVEQSARDTMQGILDTSSVNFDVEAGD